MKHKHCELIKAWADGAEIEFKTQFGWLLLSNPSWNTSYKYRIYDKFREQKEAYKQGKKIEFYNNFTKEWVVAAPPIWDTFLKYRVAPEKEYIPFTINDAKIFRGKWVKLKSDDNSFFKIERYDEYGVYFNIGNSCYYSYEDSLKKLTFDNGIPFGKLKE